MTEHDQNPSCMSVIEIRIASGGITFVSDNGELIPGPCIAWVAAEHNVGVASPAKTFRAKQLSLPLGTSPKLLEKKADALVRFSAAVAATGVRRVSKLKEVKALQRTLFSYRKGTYVFESFLHTCSTSSQEAINALLDLKSYGRPNASISSI
jgi:hypothetical protein